MRGSCTERNQLMPILAYSIDISAVLAVGRCLSVRLSVTLAYCIKMGKDIIKLFPIVAVF